MKWVSTSFDVMSIGFLPSCLVDGYREATQPVWTHIMKKVYGFMEGWPEDPLMLIHAA